MYVCMYITNNDVAIVKKKHHWKLSLCDSRSGPHAAGPGPLQTVDDAALTDIWQTNDAHRNGGSDVCVTAVVA